MHTKDVEEYAIDIWEMKRKTSYSNQNMIEIDSHFYNNNCLKGVITKNRLTKPSHLSIAYFQPGNFYILPRPDAPYSGTWQ